MRSSLWIYAVLLISCADPVGRISARETAAALESVPVRRERVLIIVREECPRCDDTLRKLRSAGGAFEALKAKGWQIGTTPDVHIQIVHHVEVPDLTKSLGDTDFPVMLGLDGEEVTRYFKTGCTTPLDPWTFGWLISGRDDRPKEPVSESAQVATTGHYRLRGNHWSVEGDFNPSRETTLAHVRGPNHAHAIGGYVSLDTWSLEELRSLHDDLHEREDGTIGMSSSRQSTGRSGGPAYLKPKTLR